MSEKTYEPPEGEHTSADFWGVRYRKDSTKSVRFPTESVGYATTYQLPHGDEVSSTRSRHWAKEFHPRGDDPEAYLFEDLDIMEW